VFLPIGPFNPERSILLSIVFGSKCAYYDEKIYISVFV
jgi:hypothetical protein